MAGTLALAACTSFTPAPRPSAPRPLLRGVPYLLSSLGIAEAEFWQLANSLQPI